MKGSMWNSLAMVLTVVLLAVGGPWLVHQVRALPHPRALAARGSERVVTLEVGGMTCSACAAKVRGEIASVRGVSDVDVRVRQGRAYVVCEKDVADTTLLSAVHRAGPGFIGSIPRD